VEALGIESRESVQSRRPESTHAGKDVRQSTQAVVPRVDVGPTSGPTIVPAGDVDAALAKAVEQAATAGRFDVVALLAGELQARRLAREGVATLAARKRHRDA
jgi:hypothetical protein